MGDLILYSYFRSSTSYRARIALYEKNLNFEYRPVQILKNQQHDPEFLRLNPQAEVPALIHNGKAIAQSLPIMEYIDEVFPGQRLYPQDPFRKAEVRQFCENINSYLHPLGNLKVLAHLEKEHGYDQAAKERWISHWYRPGLQALEKMSAKTSGVFCFGDELTAADLCLIPVLFSARRFNVDVSDFKNLIRIDEHCMKRPAFIKAHPLRQPDTPEEMRLV